MLARFHRRLIEAAGGQVQGAAAPAQESGPAPAPAPIVELCPDLEHATGPLRAAVRGHVFTPPTVVCAGGVRGPSETDVDDGAIARGASFKAELR